jgi:hypothetical protein
MFTAPNSTFYDAEKRSTSQIFLDQFTLNCE